MVSDSDDGQVLVLRLSHAVVHPCRVISPLHLHVNNVDDMFSVSSLSLRQGPRNQTSAQETTTVSHVGSFCDEANVAFKILEMRDEAMSRNCVLLCQVLMMTVEP